MTLAHEKTAVRAWPRSRGRAGEAFLAAAAPRPRLALAIVLFALLACPGALWAQEEPLAGFEPRDAQAAFDRAAKHLGLQTEKALPRQPGVPQEPSSLPKLPKGLSKTLLILAAAALALAAAHFIRLYLKRKHVAKEAGESEPAKPDAGPLMAAGQKADRLAAQGDFAEAMHALLLDTIGELKRQKGLAVPDSHTSREIVQWLGLGPLAGQCLGDIVAAVEPTWFGGLLPGQGQYQALRLKFDDFLGLLSR